MSGNTYIDQVDSYLSGALDHSAKQDFEHELENNPDLRELVSKTRLMKALLEEKRLAEVRSYARQAFEMDRTGGHGRRYMVLGGILLTGLVAAGGWYFKGESQPDTNDPKTPVLQQIHKNGEFAAPTVDPNEKPTQYQLRTEAKSEKYQKEGGSLGHEAITAPAAADPVPVASSPIAPPIVVVEPKDTLARTQVVRKKEPYMVDCAEVVLMVDIATYPTCYYQEKGAISVSHPTGGVAPYSYIIENENGQVVGNHLLKAGKYYVKLTDRQGCTKAYPVQVLEKKCPENYAFNPYVGERWTMPPLKQAGVLTIVDKAGNPYLSKPMEQGETEIWDGVGSDGALNAGYYFYHLKYVDGTEQSGSISVLR